MLHSPGNHDPGSKAKILAVGGMQQICRIVDSVNLIKIFIMKQFLSMILLILVLAACEETFDTPPRSELVAQIKFSSGTQQDNPVISAYGIEQDSIWISQVQTDEFNLPLSTLESSSFAIIFDEIADTLVISHENTINYESIESGFFYEYRIKDISHTFNRIDSIVVLDSAVTQTWNENIVLYITDLPADTETE